VVVGVDPNSDAAQKQIARGMVIQSVNRVPVTTPAELNTAITRAKSGGAKQVVLYIMRRGGVGGYVAVDLN
jgi:serine protease Do